MLEEYPESARCMEYAQLDWAAVLAPVRDELVAASKGTVDDQRGAMSTMEVSTPSLTWPSFPVLRGSADLPLVGWSWTRGS